MPQPGLPYPQPTAVAAHIPLFLYPFLNTVSKTRPFEYLRLTSLGVIGALVKVDDADVINFLLSTEIIPLCLRIMETGSELSKTVATFIVQKILLDETGLAYICATAERFYAVSTVLGNLVGTLVEQAPALAAASATSFPAVASCPPAPRLAALGAAAEAHRAVLSAALGQSARKRGAAAVPTRAAEGRHLQRLPEGRRHHQALADAAAVQHL